MAKVQSAKNTTATGAAMKAHANKAAKLLRAMGNPQRLRVLCLLTEDEMSVGQINEQVDLSQSALSQHLAVLRAEELVETRRESQTIYYSLAAGPVRDVVKTLAKHYCAPAAKRARR